MFVGTQINTSDALCIFSSLNNVCWCRRFGTNGGKHVKIMEMMLVLLGVLLEPKFI